MKADIMAKIYSGNDASFENEVLKALSLCEFEKFNNDRYTIIPGLCDVHVHFREPGFSYKETMETGSMAALAGGYTAVCTMPNLNPVPDSAEHLEKQLMLIRETGKINIYPYASITKGQLGLELSDMDKLKTEAIAFSDDGKGVQSGEMMQVAMLKAKELDKIIVAHCEDNELLFNGYIHDGKYAKENGHRGICSESEWGPIKRDIELLKKTGAKYHVCHISTKESVELIRKAKLEGVDITCETAPHYLILDDSNLKDEGRFKMNPPLRDKSDRLALIEGILDGTIDMIATDHAPHSEEEKTKGLEKSAFGIVGLETAFPLMYTYFVKTGVISLQKLIELMAINPRKRFNIPLGCDFSAWDLKAELEVDPKRFYSLGKATPFENYKLYGRPVATVVGAKAYSFDTNKDTMEEKGNG